MFSTLIPFLTTQFIQRVNIWQKIISHQRSKHCVAKTSKIECLNKKQQHVVKSLQHISQFLQFFRICVLKMKSSILLIFLIPLMSSLRILGILPFGSKSHFAIGHSILKTLKEAGHKLTVISPFPEKKSSNNYHDVNISRILERFQGKGQCCRKKKVSLKINNFLCSTDNELNPFVLGKMPIIVNTAFLYKLSGDYVELVMQQPEVKEFMQSNEKFEICVIEVFNFDALLVSRWEVCLKIVLFETFFCRELPRSLIAF